MTRLELTEDEFGMLNWFNEFPSQVGFDDAAVQSLLAKGLLTTDGDGIQISQLGRHLLESQGSP